MKRFFLVLAAVLVLLFVFGIAVNAEQSNPNWQHVRDMLELKKELPPTPKRGTNVTVSIECVRTPTLDDPGEFRATVNGGGGKDYYFQFAISDEDRDPRGFVYFGNNGTNPVFDSVQLYSTGHYSAIVYMFDSASYDNYIWGNMCEFTVTGPETASLEYKASQIVSQCRGADDWHTALNLHDWLTHNAYYDLNYEYYGADIMFRGYGVCDSYSKAYKMLCSTAGITIDRVISDQLCHAWNAISLDGKWYQVDVTWDDPAVGTAAVSGYENYDYFCLNDELMGMDHACTDASFTPGCTSLDANYYIHEGIWRKYGIICLTDDQGYMIPDANGNYRHDILLDYAEAIDNGETVVELTWNMYWGDGDDYLYYMGDRKYILFAYGMNTIPWTVNGNPAVVNATYTMGSNAVVLYVLEVGSNVYDPRLTLFLPADLTSIGSRAFAEVSARAVVIRENVVSIAEDAFEDSQVTVVYGFEGSAAETFANANDELEFIAIDADWLANH